jgi:hypothetical protein
VQDSYIHVDGKSRHNTLRVEPNCPMNCIDKRNSFEEWPERCPKLAEAGTSLS